MQLVQGLIRLLAKEGFQAFGLEKFFFGVHGLGDAVGVHDKGVARFQVYLVGREDGIGHNGEG